MLCRVGTGNNQSSVMTIFYIILEENIEPVSLGSALLY